MIVVEVAYATSMKQTLLTLRVPSGCTVRQAIESSSILKEYPEIDFNTHTTGIWSTLCEPHDLVKAGDRIEIYRPLMQNPREARIKRAKKPSSQIN